jgi:peptide/nickel transport system substrate-binding protein
MPRIPPGGRVPRQGGRGHLRMVQLVADTWIAVPIIEGMGYYAINRRLVGQFAAIPGRHELGDVFERIPRPEEKPWPK